MTTFYSASTGGFFDDALFDADTLPADVVEITEEDHQALLQGQSDMKQIVADDNGYPRLLERPTSLPTPEGLVQRIDAYAVTQYTYLNRFEVEYRERAAAARRYREAGYSGEPGIWITSFAEAAGLEPAPAADRIISQAEALADAFAQLAALRMRKREVLALDGEDALVRAQEITAAMDEVVARIE